MSWVNEKERLEKYAKTFDKSIVLKVKDAWPFKVWNWITQNKKDTVSTTFGNRIYSPALSSAKGLEGIIPHEARHVKQYRWFGFMIHPLMGIPLFNLLYALFLFPVGLAIFRVLMELDAETYRLQKLAEVKKIQTKSAGKELDRFVKILAGKAYIYPMKESWIQFFADKFKKKFN